MPDHPGPHDDDFFLLLFFFYDDVDEQSMKTGLGDEALLTDEQDLTAKVVE